MIVVAFLSLVPAGLIAAVIFLVGKHFSSTTVAATAACIGGFAVSLLLAQPTLNWITSQFINTQLNSDSELALDIMRTAQLPADRISDFCFQTSFRSSSPIADFEMSKQDFIDWMTAEGWEPQEFNDETGHIQLKGSNNRQDNSASMTAQVYPLRSGGGQRKHLVTHGHLVHRRVGNSARTFIYDVDSGRVYFCHSIY